jgi:hypothetical protein
MSLLPLPDLVPYRRYVAIDIAASTCTMTWIDAAHDAPQLQWFAITPAGFAAPLQHPQVTGGLAVALHEAGHVVSALNSAAVHHFAKSQVRRAKTHALDARLLAQHAAERRPAPAALLSIPSENNFERELGRESACGCASAVLLFLAYPPMPVNRHSSDHLDTPRADSDTHFRRRPDRESFGCLVTWRV